MGKYLLLLVGIVVVYWLVRSAARRHALRDREDKIASEDMVRCVECGVHLPRGESLVARGQYFCCAEHQRLHDPDRPQS